MEKKSIGIILIAMSLLVLSLELYFLTHYQIMYLGAKISSFSRLDIISAFPTNISLLIPIAIIIYGIYLLFKKENQK